MCLLVLLPLNGHAQPLLRCADIHALTRIEAAEGREVIVRGVITYTSPPWGLAFVLQDGSDAVYVTPDTALADQRASVEWIGLDKPATGMEVEMHGITRPGFATFVLLKKIKLLGTAKLPAAQPVTLTELRSGVFDCRRVELTGVVQRLHLEEEKLRRMQLEIAAPDGIFSVFMDDSQGLNPDKLLDASVRVIGTCLTFANSRGELVGVNLRVTSADNLQVLEDAPADPFAVPEAALFALRPFGQKPPSLHRQRLSGVVTLARPGMFLYVQGKERGFRVNTRTEESFLPGDVVEVSGFVTAADSFAVMNEALVRKKGHTPLPPALAVTRQMILTPPGEAQKTLRVEDYDGALVSLRGKVVRVEAMGDREHRVYLDCDGLLVPAILGANTTAAALAPLQAESEVEATGICAVRLDLKWPAVEPPAPSSFSLLLQSPASLRVLNSPSWWTRSRILWAFAGVALLLGAALGWVTMLRRTVARQATRMEDALRSHRDSELEFHAAQRERRHLAADLHDGLQQLITGASYRLEAAMMRLGEVPASAQEQFNAARAALDRTRTGLRECLLGLREVEDGPAEFATLLRGAVAKMEHWPKGVVEIAVSGIPFALSRHVMGSLLLFSQEAVANALEHGGASHVRIDLRYDPENLELRVEDDGCGFEPQSAPTAATGHFGLESMRHRLRWLGGNAEIQSKPGDGTCVIARLSKSHAVSLNMDHVEQEGSR
ncbi:hypothetical protein BH11VER1_BH11VER1_38380 [soil metagenome]